MQKILIFFLLYSFNINNIIIKSDESKIILKNVTNGVYNIILKKKYSCLTYLGGFRPSREKFGNTRLNFRFSKVKNEDIEKEEERRSKNSNINKNNKDINYFTIRHIYSNNYIGIKIDKNRAYPIIGTDNVIKNGALSFYWDFINIQENVYLIHNKAGCYLKEEKSSFVCSENLKRRSDFHLLKLFEEVNHTKKDLEILEKEPIDVFIKYIDLSDPNLVREGIHQIKKDKDNEELRYSIRSILKNIPWVRKIFILMPNEKVRYFKDYKDINEKIIYVKDKDILGYDSADSHAFQYRIWKMKEFGLSDNFIIMDDDCFIGKPLNKSHFFYVDNNKVFPAIINTNYEVVTNNSATKELNSRKNKIEKNYREHTSDRFMYSVYKAYIFLIKYFKSPLIVPYFTHNAIPANLNDIKEIYDIIYNSEHKNTTLFSLYRHKETLQFQTTLTVYIFNKYKRKANLINNNYIDNSNAVFGKYHYPLFCINTGNNKDYSNISFIKTKIVMENLFPIPTKYEIYNSSIVPDSIYIVLKNLEKVLTELKKQKELDDIDKEMFENEKISKEFKKCQHQIDMVKSENLAYRYIIEKRELEIENCSKNYEKLEKRKNELKLEKLKEKITEELNEKEIINENYNIIIKKYKNENDYYLKEIENLKEKQKEIYFIIYAQLVIIIIITIIIVFHFSCKKKSVSNITGNIKSNSSYYSDTGKKNKMLILDESEMDLIK